VCQNLVMDWEKLAEARIREWRARPAGQRCAPAASGSARPLELQLLEEALQLREQARAASDPVERSQLSQRSREAEMRLLVLLERTGRPLAARRFAELLSG
jgi:hypothetical protein